MNLSLSRSLSRPPTLNVDEKEKYFVLNNKFNNEKKEDFIYFEEKK